MGVIKAKNSAGEWVNVASADTVTIEGSTSDAGLYIDVIQAIKDTNGNYTSFDLTKYKDCNRYFLIYSGDVIKTTSGDQYIMFAYDSNYPDEESAYGMNVDQAFMGASFDGGVTDFIEKDVYNTTMAVFRRISSIGSSYAPSTDIVSGKVIDNIFTQENYRFGKNAIVIYAGVKEA